MAKEDTEVVVDDEGAIVVDVSDNPELVGKDDQEQVDEGAEKPQRQRQRSGTQETVRAPAVDEATQALTKAKEEAERNAAAHAATAAAERQRREAAERAATQHAQEAENARTSAESAQLQLLESGIESATGELEALEAQLAAAFESGDMKSAAPIQSKISRVAARLDRLEADKETLANAPKKERTEQPTYQPQHSDQFESYVSQFSPEAQTWLRSHRECVPPQFGGTAQANAKMMQGHYAAVAAGIPLNSPDYFRVIEENTGHRQPVSKAAEVTEAGEEQQERRPAARQQPARRPQPSAAPSREPMQANGRPTQRTVNLSKEQMEVARFSYPHLEKKDAADDRTRWQQAYTAYARSLVELEADNKIGRLTH